MLHPSEPEVLRENAEFLIEILRAQWPIGNTFTSSTLIPASLPSKMGRIDKQSCGFCVGRLIKKAAHVAVALRGAVAVVHSRALLIARARAYPRAELLPRRKCRCGGTDFGNNL